MSELHINTFPRTAGQEKTSIPVGLSTHLAGTEKGDWLPGSQGPTTASSQH